MTRHGVSGYSGAVWTGFSKARLSGLLQLSFQTSASKIHLLHIRVELDLPMLVAPGEEGRGKMNRTV